MQSWQPCFFENIFFSNSKVSFWKTFFFPRRGSRKFFWGKMCKCSPPDHIFFLSETIFLKKRFFFASGGPKRKGKIFTKLLRGKFFGMQFFFYSQCPEISELFANISEPFTPKLVTFCQELVNLLYRNQWTFFRFSIQLWFAMAMVPGSIVWPSPGAWISPTLRPPSPVWTLTYWMRSGSMCFVRGWKTNCQL